MRRRLAAASAALSGALFVLLFLLVHSVNARPLRLDRWATHWAASHRPSWAVHLARAVTTLGTSAVIYPVVIAAAACVIARGRQWWAIALPVIVFVTQTLRHLIADAVERPRPPLDLRLTGSSGWSFPSGHATLATTGLGLALMTFVMSLSTGRVRRATTAFGGVGVAFLAGLVGLSRVELGVHWLTDVIGGWLLGGFVISLVVAAIPPAPQHISTPE